MSLLNVNLSVTAYVDGPKSSNPKMKLHDSIINLMGLPTDKIETNNISLSPGETKVISSTLRTLSFTNLTTFTVTKSQATVRLSGSFGQRTGRTDGDATTEWLVANNQDLITLTFTGTGTAPNFTSMVAGDYVTLDAPFSSLNQGDFQIVKVGTNFIQFMNPIGAGETQAAQVNVYSSGPVQKGDILDITSPQFAFPNRGQFAITRITDSFVELSNSLGVPEVVTGVLAGSLNIYSNAFKWMFLATDQRLTVRLNGATDSSTEVDPSVDGDLVNSPGIMLKRGRVYQVELQNMSQKNSSGFILLAE